jgi:hypothetical protein
VRALSKLLPELRVPNHTTIYRRILKFVPEFERSVSNQTWASSQREAPRASLGGLDEDARCENF